MIDTKHDIVSTASHFSPVVALSGSPLQVNKTELQVQWMEGEIMGGGCAHCLKN